MVENVVAIELSYINTKHPDFQRETAMVGSLMAYDSLKSSKPVKNRAPVQFANPPQTNGEDNQQKMVKIFLKKVVMQRNCGQNSGFKPVWDETIIRECFG